MIKNSDATIAELVGALRPVSPLSFSQGFGSALAAAALSAGAVVALFGMRSDLLEGRFDPVHVISSGLFLVLGLSAAATVIMISRPRVGADHQGWIWAAAMVALLPLAAVLVGFGSNTSILSRENIAGGLECLTIGGGASTLVFGILVWWLRKGAPTSPDRAGLLSGVAAGSLGIFAFSLHCADNDIVHIGLWHTGVVVLTATIGRMCVPPLVRW